MATLRQLGDALEAAHYAGDTATARAIAAEINRQTGATTPPSMPEPESRKSGLWEEVMRTGQQTLSQSRTGIGALLGDEEAAALAGLERGQAIDESYGTPPSLEELKNVYEDEGALAALGELVFSQAPRFVAQQVPTLAQGAAGAKVGAALVPVPHPVAKLFGAGLGALAAYLPMFAGSNIERAAAEQIAKGEDVDVDVGKAYAVGAAQSAVQELGGALVLGRRLIGSLLGKDITKMSKEATEESLKKLADRGLLENVVRRGGTAAAGEVPTEVAQQALERYYAGLPMADEQALKEYGEAAYASVLGAGTIGGATGIGEGRANREALRAYKERQRQEQEAAAAEQERKIPRGQQDLFPDAAGAPVMPFIVEPKILTSLGIPRQAAVVKRLVGKNLNATKDREAVIAGLTEYLANPVVRKKRPEILRPVVGFVETLRTAQERAAAKQAAPAPTQMDIDEQISRSVQEEQEALKQAEIDAAYADKGRQAGVYVEPEQQASLKQAEIDAAYAEQEQQVQQQKDLDESRAAVARTGVNPAMAQAMAVAQSRGRVVEGEPQLEIPTVPPVDPVDAEIAALLKKREVTPQEEAAPVDTTAPEQLSMIGPRGGVVKPKLAGVQPKREEAADIPMNTRVMQRVDSGAPVATLLRGVVADTDVPAPLREVAAALLRVAPNINVPVRRKNFEGTDEVGQYVHPSQGEEAIYLDPRAESVPQTLVHEFIHPATVDGIARGTPAGRRLESLFTRYKEKSGNRGAYGFSNVYEFVSEALTNPAFQAELKRLEVAGTQKTYWQKFVEYVKNLLGLKSSGVLEEILDLTKDLAAAQNKVWESAERAAMTGTPAANTRFMSLQGKELLRESVAAASPKVARTANLFLEKVTNAIRKVIVWGLPLDSLNDYVQSYLGKKGEAFVPFATAVKRFTEIAHRYEGEMRRFIDAATPQIARMNEWRTKFPEMYADMTDLYFGASHAKVDLTKPESTYATMPDRLAAYKRLKKTYDKLNPAGQAIYRQMRAIHNRQFKQIAQQVYDTVYSETQDAAMATRVRNEFTKQMAAKGPLEGYAPMLRPSGKYMLKYMRPGDAEPSFEIFTSKYDQQARQAQLIAEEGVAEDSVTPFISGDKTVFDGVVPTSFLGKVMTELKTKGASKELIESIMSVGIAVSPAASVMERLATRKETPGYKRDPFWAFQEATVSLGRRLVSLKYSAQMGREVANMEAARANIKNDEVASIITDDIRKRAAYAASPSQSMLSNILTTGTYGWTLGFNVSSAVVDMSSLALITAPYLARTFGYGKTYSAMKAAAKDIMGMGWNADVETLVTEGLEGAELQEMLQTLGQSERDVVRRKTVPSMLNIDFTDPVQAAKYATLKPLVDKLKSYGHLERHSELAEASEFGESGLLSQWAAKMGFLMNASERFKREIGIKAAYDLELATVAPDGNPTPEQMEAAANHAIEMSTLLNGGSTAVTGARFQQGDFARVAFMYRRFAALQMYMQAKTMYDATMSDDPVVKKAARQFAKHSMITSAAFVGVRGMPMMGTAAAVWGLAAAVAGDDDEDNSLENFLRTNLPPVLVEGVPNIMFNANVGDRMELTNLLVRQSNLPDDATFADTVMAYFGGPAAGSAERFWRGKKLIEQGEVMRGVENMLPVSIANVLKSGRFLAAGATETSRGDTVTEITPFGAAAQMLGFSPADYARVMDFNTSQSRIDRRMTQRRTDLLEALYTAYRVGDTAGVAKTMGRIREFNAQYPKFGITSTQIKQSIATRNNNTQKMIRGVMPSERRREEWLQAAEDWGF